jgi:RecA/RadA recombinase
VALVAGEPGIGKTRLVRELVAEVAAGPGHAAVDLATLLQHRDRPGDAERAEALLDEARAVADRLDLPRLARRAGARRSEGGRAPAYD